MDVVFTKKKLIAFSLLSSVLLLAYAASFFIHWHSSSQFHTLLEVVAALLAFMVGSIALVRYYSRRSHYYLILGAGFIGTGLFDAFHAVITSDLLKQHYPSALTELIPWSWLASRLTLSIAFFASFIVFAQSKRQTSYIVNENKVYWYTSLLSVFVFTFFIFAPLPEAYYPDLLLHRPQELIPGLLCIIALWGFLAKQNNQYSQFEHWLFKAIAINIVAQVLFMPVSEELFDLHFDIAHILKILSYLFVLIGLYLSMFNSFKEVELMAQYDLLTQLPNRLLFADRFKQAIAYSNRNELMLGVCFIDLDNFKPVNDQYGHKMGDLLLIEVAKRIKAEIRDGDTVSRHGGDEFCLLLSDLRSREHCEHMLQRIHNALARPFTIDDAVLHISASSGISLYPADNADLDTLLRHADQAMYQAKISGRNRFSIFDTKDDHDIESRHIHLKQIRTALADDELSLYYQPKVNMKTGRIYGFEALLRWIHPKKGVIPPLEFLPLIEGTDVEIQVGEWVIEQALAQIQRWQHHDFETRVSVNISSYHLQSASFLPYLRSTLSRYAEISSHLLQLEILETSALNDLAAIERTLSICRNELGLQIALDDFGTGYSSLTHLRNLPVDTIKLDQSFVIDLLDDPNDFAIISGILSLSEAFNRVAIAEGIETTEHGLLLLNMNCSLAQGYGISRPMPSNEVLDWTKHYQPNQEWVHYAENLATQSTAKKQLDILNITLTQWLKRIESKVSADPNDTNVHWPILNKRKCHMGTWLDHHTLTDLFNGEWLIELKQTHAILHLNAQDLAIQYQAGQIEAAKQGLVKLQSIARAMSTIINQQQDRNV